MSNLGHITELVGSWKTTITTRQKAIISFAVFSANFRIVDFGFVVVVVPMKSLIPEANGGSEGHKQNFVRHETLPSLLFKPRKYAWILNKKRNCCLGFHDLTDK